MSESQITVAAIQAAPVFLDLPASLAKALVLIDEAAAEGARLPVFPEAFLPAWPAWVDEVLPGEDAAWHLRLLEQSVVVPGPVTDRLGAAAREGVCHVIGVAPAARFSDVPGSVPDRDRLWRGAEPDGDWMLHGYSVVVDPQGTVLAGPLVREEGILYATLDLDTARSRKRMFDPVGHYHRPDVFRLVVDDRPKPPLVSLARAGRKVTSDDPLCALSQAPA